jgi:hypothetical protein
MYCTYLKNGCWDKIEVEVEHCWLFLHTVSQHMNMKHTFSKELDFFFFFFYLTTCHRTSPVVRGSKNIFKDFFLQRTRFFTFLFFSRKKKPSWFLKLFSTIQYTSLNFQNLKGSNLLEPFRSLKVPKREIFGHSDFHDFYSIKSPTVSDFGVKIKICLKNT